MSEIPKYKKGDRVLTGYSGDNFSVDEHEVTIQEVHITPDGWAYDIYCGGAFPLVTYKFPEIYIKQKL